MDNKEDFNINELDPEILCKLDYLIDKNLMQESNAEIAIKQEPGVNSCAYGFGSNNFQQNQNQVGIDGQYFNQTQLNIMGVDTNLIKTETKPRKQPRNAKNGCVKTDNNNGCQWPIEVYDQMDNEPHLSEASVVKKQPRRRYRTNQIDPNDKKERRKFQNREAAKTYRNNQKEKAKRIETDLDEQKKVFNDLSIEISGLKAQLDELTRILAEHQQSGQCTLDVGPFNSIPQQHNTSSYESMNYTPNSQTAMAGNPLGCGYTAANPSNCNYARNDPMYTNVNTGMMNHLEPVYTGVNPMGMFSTCNQFGGINYPDPAISPGSVLSGPTENCDNSFAGSPVSDYQFMYSPAVQDGNSKPLDKVDMTSLDTYFMSNPDQPVVMNIDVLNDPMWPSNNILTSL